MAAMILRGRDRPPTVIALVHGAAAATGVALLGASAFDAAAPPLARYAFYVFLVAIAGGTTMFLGYHLRNKPIPKAIVVIHGLAAASGIVLLLAALFA